MKLIITLIVLITTTVTLFAQSRVSMTKFDLKIMNEIIDARDVNEVKIFAENASFDSVSVHYSADGKEAKFLIKGDTVREGDIACGELRLEIDRTTNVSNEMSWNTYKAKLDTSRMADYCQLKYRDARR